MSTLHIHAPPTAFQLKLKGFSIWLENLFEHRINRLAFSLRMLAAAAAIYALYHAEIVWLAQAPWPVHAPLSIVFAFVAFWTILQIVRRFHDIGRSGGLFWALAVPYWALWKMIGLFPNLWYVWLVLCAWPIKLTLALFFQAGTDGPNGYEARTTEG
jgi:uncharacterized membrane protein YhaH (DUF805 family)